MKRLFYFFAVVTAFPFLLLVAAAAKRNHLSG
jgi:hypothetical protein